MNCLGFLLLVFLSVTLVSGAAIGQPKFQATLESARQAIVRGEVKEALVFYEAEARVAEERARSSANPREDWELVSAAYREAALAAMLSGDLQKAVTYGEKAVEGAEKTKAPVTQLNALVRLREIYRAVRKFDRTKELLNKLFELTQQLTGYGKINWESNVHAHRAIDFLDQGDYPSAIDDLERSLILNQEVLDNFDRWPVRYQQTPIEFYRGMRVGRVSLLAHSYYMAAELESAITQYRQALDQIAEWKLNYFDEYRLHLGLGQALLKQGAFDQAFHHIQKGLALAERQDRSDAVVQASLLLANFATRLGNFDMAISRYQEAIRRVEASRSTLSTQFRQAYFAGLLDAYTGFVDVLVRSGKAADAFNYSERARSRVFLDILATKNHLLETMPRGMNQPTFLQQRITALNVAAEIARDESERKFISNNLGEAERVYRNVVNEIRSWNPEQASLMSVEPLTLKEVQKLLGAGQVLLQYFVTTERCYLWVVDNDSVHVLTVQISNENLSSKVGQFRKTIADIRPAREVESRARDLYRLLIEPALSYARGKELIIVPHDVLHYLPFQALYSPQGKYLVENYSIRYLSSASLMQFTREKSKPRGNKVLAFGNPDLGDPTKELKFAELEAGEIKKVNPSSTILLNKEATKLKAKSLSSQYDILHFASHAELNGDDPLSSSILLAKDSNDDGRLEVREIFGMDINAGLVVLSGCETGLGKLSSGDEFVGLTRAFIYAGTPSVVASLWKVDDASTAHLMASFYRNLKTKSKVESLRQAQLEMIRGKVSSELLAQRGVGGVVKLGETPGARSQPPNGTSTSHPYFWAPFILVGDGK